MDFISKAAQIMPGDEVVTSRLGGIYPPGLVIGHVEKVRLDPSGLYQSADIVPTSYLRSLDLMFVMSNDKNPLSVETKNEKPGTNNQE